MNILREARDSIYDAIWDVVESVARVMLEHTDGDDPGVEFIIWLDFSEPTFHKLIEEGTEWYEASAWLTDSRDPDGSEFVFAYAWADRPSFLSASGRAAFWADLRVATRQFVREETTLVDKYGDPL